MELPLQLGKAYMCIMQSCGYFTVYDLSEKRKEQRDLFSLENEEI